MKVLIDSKPIEIQSTPGASFAEFCASLLERLLQTNLSIKSCRLDGKILESMGDGEKIFNQTSLVEVESVPLTVALQAVMALRCAAIRRLEMDCEELVTESLIGEANAIYQRWHALCGELKQQIQFIPHLGDFLASEQVDEISTSRMETLADIMNGCREALGKADVVAFSDILEMKLLPWLQKLRELVHGVLKQIESSENNK